LADVVIDGQSAAKMMIDAGYAKPYEGGTKKTW
jgi:endonuclease YncB( thermonuclease family)